MVLGVYGNSGTSKELIELLERESSNRAKWSQIVIIDDESDEGYEGENRRIRFDSFCKEFIAKDTKVVIALGEPFYRNVLRRRVESKGFELASIISENATVSTSAKLGQGVVIKAGTIVSANVTIAENTWVQSNAIIGHDVSIGCDCMISSFSVCAGHTIIRDGVFVGISACIREEVKVGEAAIVGMGAIVLKNVEPAVEVLGNPARVIARNDNNRVFQR